MSIYYELRLTGTLSFKNKDDELSLKIKNYFSTLLNIEEKLKSTTILDLEKDFIINHNTIKDKYYDVIHKWSPEIYNFSLKNDYKDEDLLIKIKELDSDVFDIDFCIGNKNRFDCMELFTLLLIEYMEDNFKLVYYNEVTTKKLIVKKDSLSNYIKENIEDEGYGCSIFDTLEVEANSVKEEDEEEHEIE